MSIAVDWEIEQMVSHGDLVIEPFDDSHIQPNSYDVCLSDKFSYYSHSAMDYAIDPYDGGSISHGLIRTQRQKFTLIPGAFVLGATVEKFTLPDNIVGQITGKSSLARLGIMIHLTAGYIDAGFSSPPASITLEIVNCSNRPVILHAGMAIAQMIFTKTEKCRSPYNGKYHGQQDAEPSKYHLNSL